jgi:toxin-antitoxin system PIN domain toxin
MRCVDVNVLVYAHRADLPEHEKYRQLWEELANGEEPVGVPAPVLAGFLRVVTNRRAFVEPTAPDVAWGQVDALLAAPAVMHLTTDTQHWQRFRQLAETIDASGNDLQDAYLAAFALQNNATWLSTDRGFARFPGLVWRHPLE